MVKKKWLTSSCYISNSSRSDCHTKPIIPSSWFSNYRIFTRPIWSNYCVTILQPPPNQKKKTTYYTRNSTSQKPKRAILIISCHFYTLIEAGYGGKGSGARISSARTLPKASWSGNVIGGSRWATVSTVARASSADIILDFVVAAMGLCCPLWSISYNNKAKGTVTWERELDYDSGGWEDSETLSDRGSPQILLEQS